MKLLAADDHSLIREGLKAILSGFSNALTIIEAHDGKSIREQLIAHPDTQLLLLDVRLPDCSGFEILDELTLARPELKVVMLSAEFDQFTVTEAIQRGAVGFLPKTSINKVLCSALQLVLAGGIYVPPEVLKNPPQLAGRPSQLATRVDGKPVTPVSLGLTGRQIEVYKHLLEGKSNKQICRELDLAEATVKVHVRAILRALGVNTRTEAVIATNKLNLQFD